MTRSECDVVIEHFIPRSHLDPFTADSQYEFLMGVFQDVLEAYPGAGVTVTRGKPATPPFDRGGRPNPRACAEEPERTEVKGADRDEVLRLLAKSKAARAGLLCRR